MINTNKNNIKETERNIKKYFNTFEIEIRFGLSIKVV